MRIINFFAENIKKIKVVSIKPDGNLVEITGKNGQGKTSVLDAIWWALAGKGAIQQNPIRNGAKKGEVSLDLGDFSVTRTFKAGEDGDYTTSLKVENKDGTRPANPQAFLDSLSGSLMFDPLDFARRPAKEKFEMLQALVPGVDFKKIQAEHDADFTERTVTNRALKNEKALADAIVVPAGVPAQPMDEDALIKELTEAGNHNTALAERQARREQTKADVGRLRDEAKLATDAAAVATARAAALTTEAEQLAQKLEGADPLPEAIDVGAIRARLDAAKSANIGAQKYAERNRHMRRAQELEEKAEALTRQIAKRMDDKQAAIAAAEIPVPGLEFGEDGILLGGVPFEQASDAQQLQASIAIAGALNPRLRVIRVRDGSLLDDDAMKLLADYADKKDLQVWIERVENNGMHGFVLEDGAIKAQGA